MSGDDDLIKLYSQRILALAAEIPLTERLDGAAGQRPPPLAALRLDGDRRPARSRTAAIAAFGQDVKACALGQASASVLGART